MIRIMVTASGEPDVLPLERVFELEEKVFFGSGKMIEERVRRGLKANVNEALMLYAAHVARALRAGKSNRTIQKTAQRLLTQENVMIGVPETLQTIRFELGSQRKGSRTKTVTLRALMPTSNYVLAAR
jgi:urease gamma subunit